MKLWRSGIIWSALSFVGGMGNFVFSAMVYRRLSKPEFGYSNTALGFVLFLSLPLAMVSTSLTHYIAHFRGQNDHARLQGLLAGCQKLLFQVTIAGSLLAVILANPLGHFFNFRAGLMLVALITILVGLWSGFSVALCQGMGWFKRMAVIVQVAVGLKLIFGWIMTSKYPNAEVTVLATTFSLLANLSLLYWWKSIFRHGTERISPWNREFVHYLFVTGTYVAGNWFFINGDSLVAQKFFGGDDLGDYQVAARWAVNLPGIVSPLLLVMFTSRSGGKTPGAAADQRILMILYALSLSSGATGIILFRNFLVKLICGHPNPAAAAMIIPYTLTMTFVGMGQAIALWSLGSRWFKLTICYGSFGLIYWIALLVLGHTPNALLRTMPFGAGASFLVLLISWLFTVRPVAPAKAAL